MTEEELSALFDRAESHASADCACLAARSCTAGLALAIPLLVDEARRLRARVRELEAKIEDDALNESCKDTP